MIEVIQCRKTATTTARILTEQDYIERQGAIQTLEGSSSFQPGDYLCIGVHDEEWPQPRESFEANNELVGPSDVVGFSCYRSTNARLAFQLPDGFEVRIPTGTILRGKPGDYLVVYGNDTWVTDRSIFEKSYERIA